MFKTVFLLVVTLLLISCGQKSDKASFKISYVNSSEGEPILLDKREEGFKCPSLLTSDLDKKIIAQFHTSWSYVQVPFLLQVKTKGGLVKNSLISEVLQSGKMSYLESYVKMKFESKTIEVPEVFRACPGYDYSEEETYDSATASALFAFNEVEKSLRPINLNLKPVKLRVAPVVEHTKEYYKDSSIVRKKKTLVNNAFYFGEKSEIVFLPQGKNKKNKIPFSGVPLWKIPFVGAHEYGHHLFASLMPNFINDKKHKALHGISLCFDNSEEVSKDDNSKDGDPRIVKVSDVMDSLNEGVADLLARTILDRKYNLTGVGCFEYTRDVEKSRLANWQIKRLDKKVLDTFLLDKRVKTGNCYQEQDFQDPHIIGAIVAHGLFQLYEKANLSKTERLQAIVDWLRLLNKQYPKIKQLELKGVIEKSLYAGVKVVTDKFSVPQAELCKVIGQSFPMVHTYYGCK